jgi:hypothetical protein
MPAIKGPVVWFNRNLSNTWRTCKLLRETRQPDEFFLLCSHTRKHYAGRRHCDAYEHEPSDLSDGDYVAYCLDMVRRYHVRLFYPWRRLFPILRADAEFQALGATVIRVAGIDTLEILENKARQYAALGDGTVPVPEHIVVNDGAGFVRAYDTLRSRYPVVCYKPVTSIYALGFKIVVEDRSSRKKLPVVNEYVISLDDARRTLAEKSPFADLLVMPYLPGPERSVDCLAHQGQLVRTIVRRKSAGSATKQLIEHNPAITTLVERITSKWSLHGVFNVQFRDAPPPADRATPSPLGQEGRGIPYLLEINPRMSGGIPYGARCGLLLPYWSIRLELGTAHAEDVPHPQTGIWIRTKERQTSY